MKHIIWMPLLIALTLSAHASAEPGVSRFLPRLGVTILANEDNVMLVGYFFNGPHFSYYMGRGTPNIAAMSEGELEGFVGRLGRHAAEFFRGQQQLPMARLAAVGATEESLALAIENAEQSFVARGGFLVFGKIFNVTDPKDIARLSAYFLKRPVTADDVIKSGCTTPWGETSRLERFLDKKERALAAQNFRRELLKRVSQGVKSFGSRVAVTARFAVGAGVKLAGPVLLPGVTAAVHVLLDPASTANSADHVPSLDESVRLRLLQVAEKMINSQVPVEALIPCEETDEDFALCQENQRRILEALSNAALLEASDVVMSELKTMTLREARLNGYEQGEALYSIWDSCYRYDKGYGASGQAQSRCEESTNRYMNRFFKVTEADEGESDPAALEDLREIRSTYYDGCMAPTQKNCAERNTERRPGPSIK